MRNTPGTSVRSQAGASASARALATTSSKVASAAARQCDARACNRTRLQPGSARISAAAVIAHPQADEVALAVGLGAIDVRRAAMPQSPVVDELHLPRLEVEIDRAPVIFKDFEHRRDRGLTVRVDRLALQRIAAIDLVHAEPRFQLPRIL